MWKVIGFLATVSLVAGQNAVNNTGTNTVIASNETLSNPVSNVILADKAEVVNVTINKAKEEGTAENPFNPPELVKIADEQSLGSFKYYFVILAVSSLSVIIVIIFKAMRLRKSRAELKYGKASTSDRSEIEPLGKSNNKWLEESDDENEDELFDINFLKNSRTNLKA